LCYAISRGYARIVSIAKAKVGFIKPMLAAAVTIHEEIAGTAHT
jgi:hypothetical protein